MNSSNKKIKSKNIKTTESASPQTSAATTSIGQERLQEELERYLKITESEIKTQQEKEDSVKKTKKIYEDKLEDIKTFKKEGRIEELHNLLTEMLHKNCENELLNSRVKIQNQYLGRDVRLFEEMNTATNKKLNEFEKYNKALLEKVKEMNEEKSLVQKEESEKCETIRLKCEEFKQDFMSKFEVNDCETIKKENELLKGKVNEFSEHTKVIEENIRAQLDFKEKQFSLIEDGLTCQLTPKLAEFEEQNDTIKIENKELKDELSENAKKFEELSNVLSKFHSSFEVAKKEFEKRAQELFRVTKENRELKALDLSLHSKENEKLKNELDSIVHQNRELSDKIAKSKELLNK